MIINVGLTSKVEYNCLVGFSGKIINQNDLKIRKRNSSNVLLIHGEKDEIVSPTYLLEAKDFLLRENVNVETHLIKNCDHNIPVEASSIALNFILKKLSS
jgi:phospholipase/carboxylesterase